MDKRLDFIGGDIGLSTNNSWIAKGIKFFTSMHTGHATKSHAFICIGRGLIVESLFKISVNQIEKYENQTFDVYRIPLTFDERKDLEILLLRRIRGGYGWFKLPLFALDALATKATSFFGREKPVFFFTKIFGISNIPVCSQLVVWAIYKVTSYRLRTADGKIVDWRVISPDYLEDLLKLPINKAKLIYSQKVN